MRKSQAKVKAELKEAVSQIIEELLFWESSVVSPTFNEIEAKVLALREELGLKMVSAVLEQQESSRPVTSPSCSQCQQPLEYKDMKKKR